MLFPHPVLISDIGTGLLLGGGLSYLAAEHGFSVDALLEADVVLVNGTIVTATATNDYSDLFRALKGGANRFGIVTRYKVHAIQVGTSTDLEWFGGLITVCFFLSMLHTRLTHHFRQYDNSSSEALLTATANYVHNTNDPKSGQCVGSLFKEQ